MKYRIDDDGKLHLTDNLSVKYRMDNEGKLHEIGNTMGRVGLTLPDRYDTFAVGYAVFGLLAGGIAGFSVSLIIKLLIALYTPDTTFDYSYLDVIIRQVFAPEFIFTVPIIVTTVVFAVAGFFWDGFDTTGETFLVSLGSVGLILGGLIGFFLITLIMIVFEMLNFSDLAMAKILITALLVSGGVGFVWNGLETFRNVFSVHRAFIGIICGLLKGLLFCITLLFRNGCLIIILAVIFSPLVSLAASGIIIFYTFKGFFVIGSGGEWNNI